MQDLRLQHFLKINSIFLLSKTILYRLEKKRKKALLLHNVYIMSAFIVPNILNECF